MPQGKTEEFRSREADSATESWSPRVTQSKTSRANRRRHMVIRDPIPEVQFCAGEVDTRIGLHACYACKNDSVMHADSLTLRLMSLSYYLLIAKT